MLESSSLIPWLGASLAVLLDFASHPVLFGEVLLISAVLFFRLGKAFGIPLLFWHERPSKQIATGAVVAMLLSELFFISYLLQDDLSASRIVLPPMPSTIPSARSMDLLSYLVFGWCGILTTLALVLVARMLYRRFGADLPAVEGMAPEISHGGQGRIDEIRTPRWPMLIGLFVGLVLTAVFAFAAESLSSLIEAILPAPVYDIFIPLKDTKHLHFRAGLFFTALAGIYSVGVLKRGLGSTPAMGLCAGLGLAAAAHGFIVFHLGRLHLLWIPAAFALLWLAGRDQYKLRFPALARYYESEETLVRLDPSRDLPAVPDLLLETEEITWAKDGKKRPLFLVCASGGGIRAAVWTTAVLCELEKELGPEFPSHIRIMAGASGGMVGAAYYVSSLSTKGARERHVADHATLITNIAKDSLSTVSNALIFSDLPSAFLPFEKHWDRGIALEEAFGANMGAPMKKTFGELREAEKEGHCPSLVFSPMMVEDGRRLLISNLNLDFLNKNEGSQVGKRGPHPYSRSGYELARLFPDAFTSFPISTAARMSAAFPYVTPASVLPTLPRRRVVDAGYYENYGVNVVCGWLEECLSDPKKAAWIEANVSGIVVIQIRDGVLALSHEGASARMREASHSLSRSLSALSTPAESVMAAREAVMVFRNDEQLETVSRLYNERYSYKSADGSRDFFSTALFAFEGKVSLSWCLTEEEKTILRQEAAEAVQSDEAKKLTAWWRELSGTTTAKKAA